MPYIHGVDREDIDGILAYLEPLTTGEVNYIITKVLLNWLQGTTDTPNYQDYNELVGILECAKLELYRRMVAPYEDFKCKENGDVYRDGGGI